MHAIVTGATGFLGSHLVRLLLARGAKVTALLRTATSAGTLPPGVAVRLGDIRDGAALRTAFEGAEVVFHLAAWCRTELAEARS